MGSRRSGRSREECEGMRPLLWFWLACVAVGRAWMDVEILGRVRRVSRNGSAPEVLGRMLRCGRSGEEWGGERESTEKNEDDNGEGNGSKFA